MRFAAAQHMFDATTRSSAMTFIAPETHGTSLLRWLNPAHSDPSGAGPLGVGTPAQWMQQAAAQQIMLFDAAVTLMLMPFAAASAQPEPHDAPAISAQPPAPAALAAVIADDVEGVAPALFDAPAGAADDLMLIKGIGPKLNQLLNSLGVWHYHQIISWTPAEVSWVNAKIDFRGRIQREAWQAQAAALLTPAQAA
jgi:predicted flap endonuclease-1-like 5' DNA nuclease